MHRIPWWKTWEFVGLLSMIVWGETGCSAVMSAQVRQQADRTLAFGQLYATLTLTGGSAEWTHMTD